MAGDEVTLGELGRALSDIKSQLNSLSLAVVTREVFEIQRQTLEVHIGRVERDVRELEHQYVADKLREQEAKRAREKEERDRRTSDNRMRWGALLTGAISLFIVFVTQVMETPPA